jgi:hypothetical protein
MTLINIATKSTTAIGLYDFIQSNPPVRPDFQRLHGGEVNAQPWFSGHLMAANLIAPDDRSGCAPW